MKVNRRDSINIELSVRETWILRDLLFDPILRSTALADEHYSFAERFHDALKANLVGEKHPEFEELVGDK